MTHRQARRALGSRRNRRLGTKSKVIPGGSEKRPIKYRTHRAARGKESNASKVRKLIAASLKASAQ